MQTFQSLPVVEILVDLTIGLNDVQKESNAKCLKTTRGELEKVQ